MAQPAAGEGEEAGHQQLAAELTDSVAEVLGALRAPPYIETSGCYESRTVLSFDKLTLCALSVRDAVQDLVSCGFAHKAMPPQLPTGVTVTSYGEQRGKRQRSRSGIALLGVLGGCSAMQPHPWDESEQPSDAASVAGSVDGTQEVVSGGPLDASPGVLDGSIRALDASVGSPLSDASAGPEAAVPDVSCTRAALASVLDQYFSAAAAHDARALPLAPDVRFTEDGALMALDEGLWKSAGAATFRRDVLDPETCSAFAQAVLDERDAKVLLGVRLKLTAGQIHEIETHVTRPGSSYFAPSGVPYDLAVGWAELIAPEARSTREELVALADAYFEAHRDTSAPPPYEVTCLHFIGGALASYHCSLSMYPERDSPLRYPVIDVEAGIITAFGTLDDLLSVYMFKVRSGTIAAIQALVGRSAASGWD